MPDEFRLGEDHMKLLRRANVGWDGGEFGAPAIDCKRPYGNSDVYRDIAEILGWDFEDEHNIDWDVARDIHEEMQTALQLLCCHAGKELRPGLYRRMKLYDDESWERIGD